MCVLCTVHIYIVHTFIPRIFEFHILHSTLKKKSIAPLQLLDIIFDLAHFVNPVYTTVDNTLLTLYIRQLIILC